MQLFLASFAGTVFLATMFLTSSDFPARQFVAFERYIETSGSYVSQAPATAVALQATQGLVTPTSQLQSILQPTPQTPTQPTFPPQVAILEGSRIYVPETTYTTINSDAVEQKLLIQKDYFSKQIDRIYDRLQSTSGDLNDRIDVVGTGGSSGISFASIALGGTGISTVPSYGQLLMGDGSGGYTLIATSSLGISSGGSSQWTTVGSNIFYSGGSVLMDSFSATSTATSTIVGGLSVGTATSSGLVTMRPIHTNQPALAILRNPSLSSATPLQTWETGVTNQSTLIDENGLKINRIGSNTFSVSYSTSQSQSYNNYSLLVDGSNPGILLRSSGQSGVVSTMHLFNGSVDNPTTNGSDLGGTKFYGTDISGGYREAASISAVAESDFTVLPRVSPPRTGNGLGALVFSTNNDAVSTFGAFRPTERMRISSAGNLGIGTTSPYARLSVVGDFVSAQLHATSTTATSTIAGNLVVGSQINDGVSVPSNPGITLYGDLSFSGGARTIRGSNDALNSGDVNIQGGYMSFNATGGSVNITGGQGGSLGSAGNITLAGGAGSSGMFGVSGGTVTIRGGLKPSGPYNSVLIQPSGGNVGIGEASPTYPLHVTATSLTDVARFAGSGGTQCTVVTGTGFSCTSDERFKTNIATIDSSALRSVLKLRPVNFNWKYDPEGQVQVGFIAQELEEIFPELVRNDSSGYKSVAYAQLTPLLVKAIQEQNVSIERLALILDSQDPLPKIFMDRIVAAISEVSSLVVKTITADSVRTKELCVEDVCVTREQFLKMIRDSGARESAPRQDSTEQDSQEENSQDSTEQDLQQDESDESQEQDEGEHNDNNEESTEENSNTSVDVNTENSEDQDQDQDQIDTAEATETSETIETNGGDQIDSQTQDNDGDEEVSDTGASDSETDDEQEGSTSEQSEPSQESSAEDSGTSEAEGGTEGGSASDSNTTE